MSGRKQKTERENDPILSLATWEELYDELSRRFPMNLFHGIREAPGKVGTNLSERMLVWSGDHIHAIGMAEVARQRITDVVLCDPSEEPL